MPRRTLFPFYEFSACLRSCRRQSLRICRCFRHPGFPTDTNSNSLIIGVVMNRMFVALNVLLLCLAIGAPAHGQGGFGSISGRVTDPQGAVVPGVKVEAINDATNARQESTTNSSGYYELLDLAPGTYTVEAGIASFKKLVRKGVTVQVDDRISLDLGLEIGQASETAEVTEAAPLLRASDAQTGEVITNTLIEALPQLNRDPLQLLIVSGNVQGSGRRADGGGMAGNFGNNPMNGGDTRLN